MTKIREEKTVTIPLHEYLMLKGQAKRWQLLSAVLANSTKWADKYGPNPQGDLCRGAVEHAVPLVEAVKQTLTEGSEIHGTKARRAWDLAVVNYIRNHGG
jgi:hypothetical protein